MHPLYSLTVLFLPSLALGLGSPEQSATIYIHGYEGPGIDRVGLVGLDDDPGSDAASILDFLGLPSSLEDPSAPNQLAAIEYRGDRVPHPDSSYYDADDYAEVSALMPPHGEGGIPLFALVSAKFLRHVVERSGAAGANIFGVSFGGAISRYMLANDVDGICSDGLVSRWITAVGAVNGAWICEQPLSDPVLNFLDENSIEKAHTTYDWMRRNVDPNQPPPNHPWSPPNWGTSPGYRNTLIQHWVATDWSFVGGALHRISRMASDGVITAGDAQLAGVVAPSAWHGMQPTVTYVRGMHGPAERLGEDHIFVGEHEGAWAGLLAGLTGDRRVSIRLAEATAHRRHDGPLQGKSEMAFEFSVYSPAAQTQWGMEAPIHERALREGTAPLLRFGAKETRRPHEILMDQIMLPEEETLDVVLRVREVDWSVFRTQVVLEDPLNRSEIIAEEAFQISLDDPADLWLHSGSVDVRLDVAVTHLDMRDPRLSDARLEREDDRTVTVWWRADEDATGSVMVLGADGSRHRFEGPHVAADSWHEIRVEPLDPTLSYKIQPRAEDDARNLGRGPSLELIPRQARR